MRLLLRLASGSGRSALVRQVLVVLGIAFGTALLLVATGIATLTNADVGGNASYVATDGGYFCYGTSGCPDTYVRESPHTGSINLDYLVQPGLRHGVVVGFVLTVIPLLVFVATASRVAARRRDERFAALRLAGATRQQVRQLAVLDAMVGGVAGVVLGTVLYGIARAIVLQVDRGEMSDIVRGTTPPWWAALPVLVLLLVALAAGATFTLRAVQVCPLGVRRRAPRGAPRPWGLLLLAPLLVLPAFRLNGSYLVNQHATWLVVSLVITMFGLVLSGAWLTALVGRLVADRSGSPVLVLAGRRLQDDPRAQARAMSSVVLVVFAATLGLVSLADFYAVTDGRDSDFALRGYGAAGLGMLVSLVVGAAGLLLTTAESVLERRRTLAALHATGVPTSTLRRALIAQVALPVLPGSVLALAAGLEIGWVLFGASNVLSAPGVAALAVPLVATAAAVALTSLTLPLLRGTVQIERIRVP